MTMHPQAIEALKSAITAMIAEYPEMADDESLRADMLESETDIHAVLTLIADAEIEARTTSAAIKARMADLAERKARFDHKSASLKTAILQVMQAADLRKIVLPETTLSVRAGRQSLVIDDVEALPQGYYNLSRLPDKDAIRLALDAGEALPGARLSTGADFLSMVTK